MTVAQDWIKAAFSWAAICVVGLGALAATLITVYATSLDGFERTERYLKQALQESDARAICAERQLFATEAQLAVACAVNEALLDVMEESRERRVRCASEHPEASDGALIPVVAKRSGAEMRPLPDRTWRSAFPRRRHFSVGELPMADICAPPLVCEHLCVDR